MSFEIMNKHSFKINVTPDEPTETMEPIAAGIMSAEPSFNDEIAQDKYLDGAGFSETDVIGAQITIAFSGHRLYGDPAQDFIYDRAFGIGTARRTNFEWEQPDGSKLTGNCTITNIEGPGGEAGAKGEIAFEIHFNGEPEYTPPNGNGGGVEG